MGCPKWRADTPSHGGHPEWRAVASQLQPRVLGNGGLIVAHKGHFAKIGSFMCIVLSFQGGPLKKQALLQEAVCLDLACSPGGAPTPRPGRQGQRGRWRAGLGARGSLPFLGLAPHSPSEVRLVGPRVPRARGGGAGPGGASGLPLPRPQPVAGPDLPLVQALASSLSCLRPPGGEWASGPHCLLPRPTPGLAGSCFWPPPWASPAPSAGSGPERGWAHVLTPSHPLQA